MKLARNISIILLALVILTETIGVQVVKDICLPCHKETVQVQMLVSLYDPVCEDSCRDENHLTTETHCCNIDNCDIQKHNHQKDIQRLSNNPEFFIINTPSQLSVPVFLAVFNRQPDLLSVEKKSSYFPYFISNSIAPNEDSQSLFCSYLI
jgi:hypothetical protein